MIHHIKTYAVGIALGLTSLFSAQAQDFEPEAFPSHPTAERIVKETSSILSLETALQPAATANTASSAFGENVVKTALQYLGTRYRYGSMGPSAFDCSGFTSFVYRKENCPILRDSRSQFTQGTPVARISDLKKGDLVFFGGRRGGRSVGHVGIVTDVDPSGENFSFVHASTGNGVKISNSSESYYSRRYMGARRMVDNQ